MGSLIIGLTFFGGAILLATILERRQAVRLKQANCKHDYIADAAHVGAPMFYRCRFCNKIHPEITPTNWSTVQRAEE